MATTGESFVLTGGTSSILVGSTVVANPQVIGLPGNAALNACNAAPPGGSGVNTTFPNDSATPIDRTIMALDMTAAPAVGQAILAIPGADFVGGFAKNGALVVNLTGTTPVTVDFTSLGSSIGVTSSQAGDTSLATINALKIKNSSSSASTITVTEGASNPLKMPLILAGTTPSIALVAGDFIVECSATGQTIDSTHKTLTFTPTAGGQLQISYGGA